MKTLLIVLPDCLRNTLAEKELEAALEMRHACACHSVHRSPSPELFEEIGNADMLIFVEDGQGFLHESALWLSKAATALNKPLRRAQVQGI